MVSISLAILVEWIFFLTFIFSDEFISLKNGSNDDG